MSDPAAREALVLHMRELAMGRDHWSATVVNRALTEAADLVGEQARLVAQVQRQSDDYGRRLLADEKPTDRELASVHSASVWIEDTMIRRGLRTLLAKLTGEPYDEARWADADKALVGLNEALSPAAVPGPTREEPRADLAQRIGALCEDVFRADQTRWELCSEAASTLAASEQRIAELTTEVALCRAHRVTQAAYDAAVTKNAERDEQKVAELEAELGRALSDDAIYRATQAFLAHPATESAKRCVPNAHGLAAIRAAITAALAVPAPAEEGSE